MLKIGGGWLPGYAHGSWLPHLKVREVTFYVGKQTLVVLNVIVVTMLTFEYEAHDFQNMFGSSKVTKLQLSSPPKISACCGPVST